MDHISELFDRMDRWRHLPSYELERRADLFFSLYLPAALEAKLGFAVNSRLVPEFPVRIGTIYPHIPFERSFKIDYLALSADATKAVFVELKTDGQSRRAKQDRYLKLAKETGLAALLDGLLTIFRATKAKRKYLCLLESLGKLGLLALPEKMRDLVDSPSLRGITEMAKSIQITCPVAEHHVVYVQPNGDGPDTISFETFAEVVTQQDDAVSTRFAKSLAEWATYAAGHRVPEQ